MPTCDVCSATLAPGAVTCPACGTPPSARPELSAPREGHPTEAMAPGLPRGPVGAGFTPGEILAGRYRIVGLLGRGGMGEVYRADDLRLGQPVALKFLPPALEADREALERLHGEVRAAHRVSHPHVCRVHDIGEAGGRAFLSMEFVDGEDLESLLRRIGRLSEGKAIEVARQVCAGLQAAHDQGVVHRDLKPANVMIDGRGRARITDFGLAAVGAQRPGEIAGTPAYMAPEQLRGEPATARSDLYALGLLLYEICTGRRPFHADSLAAWRQAHLQEVPSHPSAHTTGLDPGLERLILRCLEKDPSRRPASAALVAAALPGGDPLAAALAAGETPSPEQVAASESAEGLAPWRAFLGAALVAGLALLMAGANQANLFAQVPFEKSPEVLADRARTLLAQFGVPAPSDRAWGYDLDESYLDWEQDPLPAPARWKRLRSGHPVVYRFWYRQGPGSLRPRALLENQVTEDDPPLDEEGRANLILDGRGRLVAFSAVGPARLGPPASGRSDREVFGPLFGAAGLDPAAFSDGAPGWTPPVPCDRVTAWTGSFPDHPDLPLRIEAASLQGRPVHFRLTGPWEAPPLAAPPAPVGGRKAAGWIILALAGALALASLHLARRNLRAGRGDRRGALRLGLVVAGLMAWSIVLMSNRTFTAWGPFVLLASTVSRGLFVGSFAGLAYLALEPTIRRHRPGLLVSWHRLLAGEVRNPLVGRDLLAGCLLGLGSVGAVWLAGWVKVWTRSPFPPNHYLFPPRLEGLQQGLAGIGVSLLLGFLQAILVLMGMVLARRTLRREGPALVALWAVLCILEVLAYARSLPAVAATMVAWGLYVSIVARRGFLAGLAGYFCGDLLLRAPLTLDPGAPYAGPSFLALGLVLAVGAFGAWLAVGARPAVPEDEDAEAAGA